MRLGDDVSCATESYSAIAPRKVRNKSQKADMLVDSRPRTKIGEPLRVASLEFTNMKEAIGVSLNLQD